MLDELLGLLFRDVLVFALRFVLFPVALLLSTPFILIHAAVLSLRGRGRFGHLVADDCSSIDIYWWN
jgi:hypothetical protein